MHPSELKNMALVAALSAEREGFPATAEALLELAISCSVESMSYVQARHPLLASDRVYAARGSRA
jgi:hypothetical protein